MFLTYHRVRSWWHLVEVGRLLDLGEFLTRDEGLDDVGVDVIALDGAPEVTCMVMTPFILAFSAS